MPRRECACANELVIWSKCRLSTIASLGAHCKWAIAPDAAAIRGASRARRQVENSVRVKMVAGVTTPLERSELGTFYG